MFEFLLSCPPPFGYQPRIPEHLLGPSHHRVMQIVYYNEIKRGYIGWIKEPYIRKRMMRCDVFRHPRLAHMIDGVVQHSLEKTEARYGILVERHDDYDCLAELAYYGYCRAKIQNYLCLESVDACAFIATRITDKGIKYLRSIYTPSELGVIREKAEKISKRIVGRHAKTMQSLRYRKTNAKR